MNLAPALVMSSPIWRNMNPRLQALTRIHADYKPSGLFVPEATDEPLAIGPVLAEFGHELFVAAMARYKAQFHGKVTVCTRAGREALWADFADKIIAHDIQCESAVVLPRKGNEVPREILQSWRAQMKGAEFPIFEYLSGMSNRVSFVVYGKEDAKYRGVTVVHARARDHVLARNWPVSCWERLVAGMREKKLADRVVCIGSPAAAALVPGCEDMRGLPLSEQMNVLRSAKLAVGPSSGPMHMASLCKCPHVVWCGGTCRGWGEIKDTQNRYVKAWNPFQTPALALACPTWRPTVDTVFAGVAKMLDALAAGRNIRETAI